MTLGLLVLVLLLVAGCGYSRNANEKAMDAKFSKLDYEMASIETINSAYNDREFERETRKYIALVREYAHQLGPAEARRRLKEKGDELSAYCLPCTAELTDAALKY
jgi:hypothetical protein